MAGRYGGCVTSVIRTDGEGRQATGGDTLRTLLDCGAGLLPFEPTHYALKRSVQTGLSVAAAILVSRRVLR